MRCVARQRFERPCARREHHAARRAMRHDVDRSEAAARGERFGDLFGGGAFRVQ
jgi:hypothetical protein